MESVSVLSGRVEIAFADREIVLDQGDFLSVPGPAQHSLRARDPGADLPVMVARDGPVPGRHGGLA